MVILLLGFVARFTPARVSESVWPRKVTDFVSVSFWYSNIVVVLIVVPAKFVGVAVAAEDFGDGFGLD